jgi:tRNA-dihydrouridine synthase
MSQVSLPQELHPDLPLTALAPMQDVTNHWFMKVIAHYGSPDYFFTEYFRVNDTSRLNRRYDDSITWGVQELVALPQFSGSKLPRKAMLITNDPLATTSEFTRVAS